MQPTADGEAELRLTLEGKSLTVPLRVSGLRASAPVDFVHDVAPVLSKLGCNAGTCHGSAKGKNGFKLSLRGYDPIFDVRALTDDLAGRRVNRRSPDRELDAVESLRRRAAHGRPGHRAGGRLLCDAPRMDRRRREARSDASARGGASNWFRKIRSCRESAAGSRFACWPPTPTAKCATSRRGVHRSGQYGSSHASRIGLMTAVRRGEAPILARYEGAYAATTLTVMGDRSGFAWQQPPNPGARSTNSRPASGSG